MSIGASRLRVRVRQHSRCPCTRPSSESAIVRSPRSAMKISVSVLRFAAALLVGIGLVAPVRAQEKADNWLTRLFQPPATAAVPSAGGTREWSGESGASGHPLMTADAIRVAAADFANCLEGLWP